MKLKIKSEAKGYVGIMVWPETAERLKTKAKKEGKSLVELLDELSKKI